MHTNHSPRRRRSGEPDRIDSDPLWFKDAIIYELHVRAFSDSNGDGSGDFKGLISRLPYLQDLGVSAIWLLPFYPSPLRDDGYDIADYGSVNPMFGDLGDAHAFIKEAHRRGIRVITELVCNHTSDQHPWFQRARRARPGSVYRDFYVWSNTNQRYQDARIIFKDFEVSNWTWDQVAGAYYWHRFYSHQPDLNYDNPRVKEALFKTCDFWLDLGVDGMRLDAVPYLFEREGTNCENLPETHAFLRELRKHIDDNYPNRMLLAEANQWPEDAVAYFGNGDECHMNFHFPLMPRLFMSIRMEDRFPIVDILAQTPPIPENNQWALFLRNHDELTLEMVTDEERDYMYRSYTQDRAARINLGIRRRLAPLLGNDRKRIELMNGLLLSLPGTPVIYYGDEIGMGDNIFLGDRNGVRTPMQWSGDRNAGFSDANRQRVYLPVVTDPEYHYEAINVEAQAGNPHSLLSWMKRVIALRKRHRAFGRGTLELLRPENRKVLAFVRRYESEQILCVANLSRFLQVVELDLAQWKGMVPVELFGSTELPPIGDTPYYMTLGPHSFYWFSLAPKPSQQLLSDWGLTATTLPEVRVPASWESVLTDGGKEAFEGVLVNYVRQRRWFAGKARRLKSISITDWIDIRTAEGIAYLATIVASYAEGDPDTYLLPIAHANAVESSQIIERWPHAAIAWVKAPGQEQRGLLYDALGPPGFADALLSAMARRRRFSGPKGTLVGSTTKAFVRLRGPETIKLEANLSAAEQSNNSVVFGERLILKVFRRVEEGINPELELGRFLTERTSFAQIAPLAGGLEYRPDHGDAISVAVLQGYVPNQGDAWKYTQSTLASYFKAVELLADGSPPALPPGMLFSGLGELPELAVQTVGAYLDSARLLGKRTAELHLALASDPDDIAFSPERISPQDQRSIYQSISQVAMRALELLRGQQNRLPQDAREDARQVLELEPQIARTLKSFLLRRLTTTRIRVHGDYHLGQVLYTGHDFVIIDFEGEPTRTLYERRLKRPALRDVAGMLRSFHYAAQAALRTDGLTPELLARMQPWARFWVDSVSVAFLRSYLSTAGTASFVPQTPADLELQLTTMLLEKALYELRYELNMRPDWVRIPLRGICDLVAPG
ncbi:MAG TPA: maltose alpha-D-glucosyltransferase [Candidatus Dormibacteraeota bacterium]|nr:maltose alpha-D-glucosyltransferase [Candidatus Dormibacteraeota bacterium]